MADVLTVNNARIHLPKHLREDIERYVFKAKDRYDDDDDVKKMKYEKRLSKPFPTLFDFWVMAVIRGVKDTRAAGGKTAPELFDPDEYEAVVSLVTTRGDTSGKFVEHDVEQVLLSIYIADHPPKDTDTYKPTASQIIDYLDRYAAAGTEPMLRDLSERMGQNEAAQTVLPHVLMNMSKVR